MTCDDAVIDSSDFTAIGAALDGAGLTRTGPVGSARCRLMRRHEAVDFTLAWMDRERRG